MLEVNAVLAEVLNVVVLNVHKRTLISSDTKLHTVVVSADHVAVEAGEVTVVSVDAIVALNLDFV